MWASLVVGLLFLAGSAYNLFGPEPNSAEAIAGLTIGVALVGLFAFLRVQQRQAGDFHGWLSSNADSIRAGKARYQGVPITPATVLARYRMALSFLVMSYRISTRPYIVDHDATAAVATVCSAASLLFGWWGIPWGPVYTFQSLSSNLRGGLRYTVGDVLGQVPQPAPAA
jgi:hypothetical protein